MKVGFAKYWLLFLGGYKQNTSKQKGFISLQFLQKLSHQKPFKDKARLSSLVNKL